MTGRRFDFIPVLATAVLFSCVAIIEGAVLKHTGGILMYPLDDTFIHMELAKNLSYYGVWGIDRFDFGSASSSLFYTMFLGGMFKIFQAHTIIPLLINMVAAIMLLFVINDWLRKQQLTPLSRFLSLVAVIFITPLPVMVVSGMEHTLQCLFTFLFIYKFSDWVISGIQPDGSARKLPASLLVYAVLVSTIRYEGFFIIAIACLIMLYYRRIKAGFWVGVVALLPILIFGIYSISKGSYFFPNSVLLKAEKMGSFTEFFKTLFLDKLTFVTALTEPPTSKSRISLIATQQLLIILPVLLYFFVKKFRLPVVYTIALIVLFCTTLLHLTFASTGWFYRYEAYLFCCSAPIFCVMFYKSKELFLAYPAIYKRQMFAAGFILFLLLPVGLRSVVAFAKSKQACINIYEQQYQMGRFIAKFYHETPVAVNDIGVISFKSEARNLDLWGLGSIDVAKSKKEGYSTVFFLDSLSRQRNVLLAIVYDSWFTDSLLNRWRKVATWKIENNVICGDDIVSFYAIDTSNYAAIKQNLMKFESDLPAGVQVKYY